MLLSLEQADLHEPWSMHSFTMSGMSQSLHAETIRQDNLLAPLLVTDYRSLISPSRMSTYPGSPLL